MPKQGKTLSDKTATSLTAEIRRSRTRRLLQEALRTVAPGTELRSGIDNIIRAREGALIVIGDGDDVKALTRGGFSIDCPMTAMRLYELAKMDGAMVLDCNAARIKLANAHLMPDSSIPSEETGMRHRTAEQVARQTGNLVICISQRRESLTLFLGNLKYDLEDLRYVLEKANQAIQTLSRYRDKLDVTLIRLNALEFEGTVTLADVLIAAQRAQFLLRIGQEASGLVLELGAEGRLVRMQVEELIGGVQRELDDLILDYADNERIDIEEALVTFHKSGVEELQDWSRLARTLGYSGPGNFHEIFITPRGYRLLDKVPRLPESIIHNIVHKFGDLPSILSASEEELDVVEGIGSARAAAIVDGLKRIGEQSASDRQY